MNRKALHLFYVLVIIILALSLLAGCSNEEMRLQSKRLTLSVIASTVRLLICRNSLLIAKV